MVLHSMQGSATVCLTMVTDENVYTSQAYEAHLAVKVGTVLEAGAEQQLKGNDGFLQLFVTTFQAHGGGHHFEF